MDIDRPKAVETPRNLPSERNMEIKEELRSLIKKVEGGLACILVSSDGEAIEFSSDMKDPDVEWVGARFGVVVRDILSAVKHLNQGIVRSMVVELAKGSLVVTPLRDDFFLMLLVHPEGNLGQALFHTKIAASALERELAI
jgi:predicted regulator of Ras-like GTPase activity (Roadblock/LC7/MglB family)